MLVDGVPYRTIWLSADGLVQCIDQRPLPFKFVVETLLTSNDVCVAIADMHVRGAGCIGATAAFGMYV
jgi:methylthioribose-1-phosphate isomerase